MAPPGRRGRFHEFFTSNPEQLRACEQLIRVLDVNKAAMQVFDFTDKAEFMAQVHKISTAAHSNFFRRMVAYCRGKTEFQGEGQTT